MYIHRQARLFSYISLLLPRVRNAGIPIPPLPPLIVFTPLIPGGPIIIPIVPDSAYPFTPIEWPGECSRLGVLSTPPERDRNLGGERGDPGEWGEAGDRGRKEGVWR